MINKLPWHDYIVKTRLDMNDAEVTYLTNPTNLNGLWLQKAITKHKKALDNPY